MDFHSVLSYNGNDTMTMPLDRNNQLFLYLIACALKGKTPERSVLEGADWSILLQIAEQQKMTVMLAVAADLIPEDKDDSCTVPEEIRQSLSQARLANLRRRMLFDTERQRITAWMDQNKIWYIPLKGIILQDLYPVYEMREMTDNDILFDAGRSTEVRAFFKKSGYSHLDELHVDGYVKKPFYNFEMHKALFLDSSKRTHKLQVYFEGVEKRSVPAGGNSSGLFMTPEDFYIHFIAHFYKHVIKAGCGLRPLADQAVIRRHCGNQIYTESFIAKLKDLDLLSFAETTESLSDKLFEDSSVYFDGKRMDFTDKEAALLTMLAEEQIYGSMTTLLHNRMNTLTGDNKITAADKRRYLWRRIFPSREVMPFLYPVLQKTPVLLPVMYVDRLFRRVLTRRGQVIKELRELKKLS